MNLRGIGLIENFVEAYNAFDVGTMLSLVHPDIRFTNLSSGVVDVQTSGRKEFEALVRQSVTLFTHREQRILAAKETEAGIQIDVFYRATLAVDLPQGLAKGVTIELTGKSTYTFKEGLIHSIIDES